MHDTSTDLTIVELLCSVRVLVHLREVAAVLTLAKSCKRGSISAEPGATALLLPCGYGRVSCTVQSPAADRFKRLFYSCMILIRCVDVTALQRWNVGCLDTAYRD